MDENLDMINTECKNFLVFCIGDFSRRTQKQPCFRQLKQPLQNGNLFFTQCIIKTFYNVIFNILYFCSNAIFHFVNKSIYKMKYHSLMLMLVLLVTGTLLHAQELSVAPVTRTIALENAIIIPQPGQMIERGTVIIKDGLIEAVGQNVDIPVNAKVIDADSMYVYPGFIDGASHTGVTKPDDEQEQQGRGRRGQGQQIDRGNPPNEVAGILPERHVEAVMDMSDRSVEDMRKLGFTTAHIVPEGNTFPGKGAIVLLKDEGSPFVRKDAALFSQLRGAGRVYPSTIIAVMSKWRELYKQAEQAKMHEAMYAKNPKGMERPNYSETLRAFYPIIEQEQPVFFAADGLKDIHRVFTLHEDLGFPLVLVNVKEGWHHMDAIQAKNVPTFLSLELPEFKGKKDEKKEDEQEEKPAQTITDKEKEMLEKRRMEEMKKYETQAAEFAKKGITFGFSALEVKANDVRANLRRLVKAGLSEEAALAALTTNPAKMLGLSDMMGTIEPGKMGNVFVTDKPYFEEKSNVRYVFVDGEMYEYEARSAKAGDPNATAKPSGNWSYSISTPQGEMTGMLTIEGEVGNLSGSISNSMTNQATSISGATLSGNILTFSSSVSNGGQSMTINYELIIEGDTFEGTASVGSFGSFEMEGERDPN